MCSKKRPNNATSNYLVSMRAGDLDRNSTNFLGKLRANFVGTEFQVCAWSNGMREKQCSGLRQYSGLNKYNVELLYGARPSRSRTRFQACATGDYLWVLMILVFLPTWLFLVAPYMSLHGICYLSSPNAKLLPNVVLKVVPKDAAAAFPFVVPAGVRRRLQPERTEWRWGLGQRQLWRRQRWLWERWCQKHVSSGGTGLRHVCLQRTRL